MSKVAHTKDNLPAEGKGLRRTGIAGMALGVIALIACELPVVLALIGLGGLGAGAMAFRLPPLVEVFGIMFAAMGVALLTALPLRRRWKHRKSARS